MSALLRPIDLKQHREVVRPEWADYNNHLNDAFYLVIFSHATDAMMDQIGLDAAERERTKHSLFTAELHLNYLKEVKVGTEVRVETTFLGHDAKRSTSSTPCIAPTRPSRLQPTNRCSFPWT